MQCFRQTASMPVLKKSAKTKKRKVQVFGALQMNILLKSLSEVEKQFGKKATMANTLLDMVLQGEKAWGFLTGTMDNGWDVTVGFFNNKARYVRFKKRRGSK